MFKSYRYARGHSLVNGYYRLFITDTQFEVEELLPLDAEPFLAWESNHVYSAYLFAFYKHKKMNPVQNYFRFIRTLYGATLDNNIKPPFLSHISVLEHLFPDYYLKSKDCLIREVI